MALEGCLSLMRVTTIIGHNKTPKKSTNKGPSNFLDSNSSLAESSSELWSVPEKIFSPVQVILGRVKAATIFGKNRTKNSARELPNQHDILANLN